MDPAFDGAGQKQGVEMWRVEQMKLVPLENKDFGTFYSGDAYILLADEQTVAAYKSVELDDALGGGPVQHREVQGNESSKFLSYFDKRIRYLKGGVSTGLKHVDPDSHTPVLYKVKGKRQCRVIQVLVSVKSLNMGDVFVLDAGTHIYIWSPPEANRLERNKGAEFARHVRDFERSGRAHVHLIESEWNTHKEFYKLIGGNPGDFIQPAEKNDDQFEACFSKDIKLFRVSDDSGRLKVTKVKGAPYTKEHLEPSDCFILDLASFGIYAWVGSSCSPRERQDVWPKALAYLASQNLPVSTPVSRVTEGCEPAIFRSALNFPEEMIMPQEQNTHHMSRVAKIDESAHPVDMAKVYNGNVPKAADFMPDNGTGTKMVWRVEKFFLASVQPENYGTFYSGDSYVILYQCKKETSANQSGALIYFWQGSHSTLDERAASAMLAVAVDEKEFGGSAMQIRVTQNKEPAHFMKIFNGHIIILLGGHESGFKATNERQSYDEDGVRLFQAHNDKIIQVPESASSLNSNDVFVLETEQSVYIWFGKGANTMERDLAKAAAQKVTHLRNLKTIQEGEEPDEFWQVLGGKCEYASGAAFQAPNQEARLFQCSNARGYFSVEEVIDFTQQDLVEDDVMLLDTYAEVFIWIGQGANEKEKQRAMKSATEYVAADGHRSVKNTGIYVVHQGNEPPAFTGHFGAWDPDLWQKLRQDNLGNDLEEENSKIDGVPALEMETLDEAMAKYSKTYPIDVLKQENLPEGVDALHKEKHLNDADFENVFGMVRSQFEGLQPWKKLEKKKAAGLF